MLLFLSFQATRKVDIGRKSYVMDQCKVYYNPFDRRWPFLLWDHPTLFFAYCTQKHNEDKRSQWSPNFSTKHPRIHNWVLLCLNVVNLGPLFIFPLVFCLEAPIHHWIWKHSVSTRLINHNLYKRTWTLSYSKAETKYGPEKHKHIWFGISERSSWKERPARFNKSQCTVLSRIEARSKFPSVPEGLILSR